eukprot:7158453-Prymnesium_polylepis.2
MTSPGVCRSPPGRTCSSLTPSPSSGPRCKDGKKGTLAAAEMCHHHTGRTRPVHPLAARGQARTRSTRVSLPSGRRLLLGSSGTRRDSSRLRPGCTCPPDRRKRCRCGIVLGSRSPRDRGPNTGR